VFQDAAPALFGVEGLQVADVQAGPGGAVQVRAITDWPAAAACPDCGTVSSRLHETVVTRPRDVRRAGDPVDLRWKEGTPGNQPATRSRLTSKAR
jgi:transposase